MSQVERMVIVGGTSGIGLAVAKRAIKDNKEVIIIGRSSQRLEEALTILEGKATGYVTDAADKQAVTKVFEKIGSVQHVVITAANHGGVMPLSDITLEALNEGMRGKLQAHLWAAQAAAKIVQPGGSITFVSAITARTSMPATALLAAINGAIASIVPVLAVELAPVRVNAVLPGTVDADWWDWLPAGNRETVFGGMAKTLPVGRVGTTEDIADAITFLVNNTYTTGVLLPCDGGAQLVVGKG